MLGIALIAGLCMWSLGLAPGVLFDSSFRFAGKFFASAFQPALVYEDPLPGTPRPFLIDALFSLAATFRLALLAMCVSVPCGAVLAIFASSAWWPDLKRHPALTIPLRALYYSSRAFIAFARSIHELLWGLLFITAIGLSTGAAIAAVAIPYSGILAKIYAEMLEEHSRDSQNALRAVGASGLAGFAYGLLPRALPDLISYSFYRLECALRSAAVFGFIGVETIGTKIFFATQDRHYSEVWTYLYLLVGACALLEWWGHAIRRRIKPEPSN